jgi:hypothetical protein
VTTIPITTLCCGVPVSASQKWRSARKVEMSLGPPTGAASRGRRSATGRGCEAAADPDRAGGTQFEG